MFHFLFLRSNRRTAAVQVSVDGVEVWMFRRREAMTASYLALERRFPERSVTAVADMGDHPPFEGSCWT